MSDVTQTPAWQKMAQLKAPRLSPDLRQPQLSAAGITLDASRQPLNADIIAALFDLAAQEDIDGARAQLFAGDIVNPTEKRAALHWQWRMEKPPADIAETKARMQKVVRDIRSGTWRGATGQPIRHIVNIGIGGSDLGPRLVYDALAPLHGDGPQLHFISNVDPEDLARIPASCPAAETLFIVVSKSMGTLETQLNAKAARAWLQSQLGDKLEQHLLAVTTNLESAAALGIPPENCFGFASTIGGRFSIWSPVGLGPLIALGEDVIAAFHAGAAAMDAHFKTVRARENLPMWLALLSLWQVNFQGATAEAILPYATRLGLLPAYLQQLAMESTGKSITIDGAPVTMPTGPILFGSAGTLGQHSFYQLLHQGTAKVSCDFILPRSTPAGDRTDAQQQWLVANGLAQSAALAYGHVDADPHRRHPGNRPSTLLLMDSISPESLGALIALYEHKTFVLGRLWRINPFDQYGVELGKVMAADTYEALAQPKDGDPLLDFFRRG